MYVGADWDSVSDHRLQLAIRRQLSTSSCGDLRLTSGTNWEMVTPGKQNLSKVVAKRYGKWPM